MEKDSQNVVLVPADFGTFWKYIEDENITDIDYNGSELWIKNIYGEKTIVERDLPFEFLDKFCQRVADSVNGYFTPADPILEAETETLRISCIHEVLATSGRSICIRHVSEELRIKNGEEAVANGYCTEEIFAFLINCIFAKLNVAICGEMGIGKSECARLVTHYIPNEQRVITIEDSPEWHFKKINPGHDCVELKVGAGKTYSDLLKACLRQDATWVMLSEARGREVVDLVENLMSGARCVTTLHAYDARKIPGRMISMSGSKEDAERMEYNIYECLDIGILIRMKQGKRYIDQVCFFSRESGENKSTLLVSNGELTGEKLPDKLMERFLRKSIENPFICEEMWKEEVSHE